LLKFVPSTAANLKKLHVIPNHYFAAGAFGCPICTAELSLSF
jgi:hypothetical protein